MSDAPDYDAIEARANAATPGRWVYSDVIEGDHNVTHGGWDVARCSDGGYARAKEGSTDLDIHEQAAKNAEFIAHARTDVPALIARCRELEAKVAAVRVEADSALAHPDPYLWQVGHAIEAILDSTGDPTP